MSLSEIDPDVLLEWLQTPAIPPDEDGGDDGGSSGGGMQQVALEQLCMVLLMSDNIDRCFELCPPRTFLPALCHIMISGNNNLCPNEEVISTLEVCARAMTYYLDVSAECSRRIVQVDGAVKSLCDRLLIAPQILIKSRTARDLAEQCIKVLERVCSRESGAVFDAGGLNAVLTFIQRCSTTQEPSATDLPVVHGIHKDTLHSAMTVVTRLCSKVDPTSRTGNIEFVGSLSGLLSHSDQHVSEGALRCFATLADRFSRRVVDPAPLVEHGPVLLEHLLNRLAVSGSGNPSTPYNGGATPNAAMSAGLPKNSSSNLIASAGSSIGMDLRASQQSISTVTSLMSTLCRESPSITQKLVQNSEQLCGSLISAACYSGDERISLDTMRFTDLLLMLIFTGRSRSNGCSDQNVRGVKDKQDVSTTLSETEEKQASGLATVSSSTGASTGTAGGTMLIPPTNSPNSGASTPPTAMTTGTTLKAMLCKKFEGGVTSAVVSTNSGTVDSRLHRSVIENIRNKDTQAVKDAVESGGVDVNFTDDVGQTLLNWAAAFGTAEMVDLLCMHGSDVNRGVRLSSLHYAACFGRPQIARTLLKYGANPELRDEDGNTPLDKARERNDEGHRAVAHILQSPSEWVGSVVGSSMPGPNNLREDINNAKNKSAATVSAISSDCSMEGEESNVSGSRITGDEAMAREYISRLLPAFASLFLQQAMQPNMRKAALTLVRKMAHFCPPDLMLTLTSAATPAASQDKNGFRSASEETSALATPSAPYQDQQCSQLAVQLVQVIAAVLDNEEDYDSQLGVLSLMGDLGSKAESVIVAQFVRLGVAERVRRLSALYEETTAAAAPVSIEDENKTKQDKNVVQNIIAEAGPSDDSEVDPGIELESGVAYYWKDWTVIRRPAKCSSTGEIESTEASKETQPESKAKVKTQNQLNVDDNSVYIFNRWCAIQLAVSSNGWFKYLMDRNLYTMYSSGKPTITEGADSKQEFSRKLLLSKSEVKQYQKSASDKKTANYSEPQGIPLFKEELTSEEGQVVKFGPNWRFALKAETADSGIPTGNVQLQISNVEGSQATLLSGWSAPGFVFRSIANKKIDFKARVPLLEAIAASQWCEQLDSRKTMAVSAAGANSGRIFGQPDGPKPATATTVTVKSQGSNSQETMVTQNELLKRRVIKDANTIYEKHLKRQAKEMQSSSETMRRLFLVVKSLNGEDATEVGDGNLLSEEEAFKEIARLFSSDSTVTSFELQNSGLVQSLLSYLSPNSIEDVKSDSVDNNSQDEANRRLTSFGKCINEIYPPSLALLARKIVQVLDSVERLPVFLYPINPNSGSNQGLAMPNMQILNKRFKLRLERLNECSKGPRLLDRSGRILKVEPLLTSETLHRFLLRIVARQWYDRERSTFHFLKSINSASEPLKCEYEHDFDKNGMVYWIGTNAYTCSEWVNPAEFGVVHVSCSDGKKLPYGKLYQILSRDQTLNVHSSDDRHAWFAFDFGVHFLPSAYTLRHARGYGKSALRYWAVQFSYDGINWVDFKTHINDSALSEPGSTYTWTLDLPSGTDTEKGFRHMRIMQGGKNSSNQTCYISISGLELYGTVLRGCEDEVGRAAREVEAINRRQRKKVKSQVRHLLKGAQVVRGPDWKWRDQDGGVGSVGTITGNLHDGWVDVRWDNEQTNSYRMGAEAKYDLQLSPEYESGLIQQQRCAARASVSTSQIGAQNSTHKVTPTLGANASGKCKSTPSLLSVAKAKGDDKKSEKMVQNEGSVAGSANGSHKQEHKTAGRWRLKEQKAESTVFPNTSGGLTAIVAENEDVKKVYHLVQESVAREKEHANAKESMSQSDLQTTGQFPPRPKGGRKHAELPQSNRKMTIDRESNRSASANINANNPNNYNNNNNNKSNSNNRKQTKPSTASSLVARLSLFERLLATRGERFQVNQLDAENATSLSDLAAELSDEMGTLIDLMNLMGDLPSSREQPSGGTGTTGRSIEDSFLPTDELFELTSAAAGLLMESDTRFGAERNSSSERSKSRVSSGGTNNEERKEYLCRKSLTGDDEVSTGVLTATESQDSLVADDGSKSGSSIFGCPNLASELTEQIVASETEMMTPSAGSLATSPGNNPVSGVGVGGANLISLSVPNLTSSGSAQAVGGEGNAVLESGLEHGAGGAMTLNAVSASDVTRGIQWDSLNSCGLSNITSVASNPAAAKPNTMSGVPASTQSSDMYFLTNLVSQTTQSFPSLSVTKSTTTAQVNPSTTMSYRKAALGSHMSGGGTVPGGNGRLHRFGSSDSDMEQPSSVEGSRDRSRNRFIDSSNSGAGDGSFPLIDAKSMSDFFSEIDEEFVEEFPTAAELGSTSVMASRENPSDVNAKVLNDSARGNSFSRENSAADKEKIFNSTGMGRALDAGSGICLDIEDIENDMDDQDASMYRDFLHMHSPRGSSFDPSHVMSLSDRISASASVQCPPHTRPACSHPEAESERGVRDDTPIDMDQEEDDDVDSELHVISSTTTPLDEPNMNIDEQRPRHSSRSVVDEDILPPNEADSAEAIDGDIQKSNEQSELDETSERMDETVEDEDDEDNEEESDQNEEAENAQPTKNNEENEDEKYKRNNRQTSKTSKQNDHEPVFKFGPRLFEDSACDDVETSSGRCRHFSFSAKEDENMETSDDKVKNSSLNNDSVRRLSERNLSEDVDEIEEDDEDEDVEEDEEIDDEIRDNEEEEEEEEDDDDEDLEEDEEDEDLINQDQDEQDEDDEDDEEDELDDDLDDEEEDEEDMYGEAAHMRSEAVSGQKDDAKMQAASQRSATAHSAMHRFTSKKSSHGVPPNGSVSKANSKSKIPGSENCTSMRTMNVTKDYTGMLRRRRGEHWRHHQNHSAHPPATHSSQPNENTNDEIILKRAFPAFVPAFDPRPGRTNLPANVDFVVENSSLTPASVSNGTGLVQSSSQDSSTAAPQQSRAAVAADSEVKRLRLFLKLQQNPSDSSAAESGSERQVLRLELTGGVGAAVETSVRQREETLISCVQRLHLMSVMNGNNSKSVNSPPSVTGRRMWDITYVIEYMEDEEMPPWSVEDVEKETVSNEEVKSFLEKQGVTLSHSEDIKREGSEDKETVNSQNAEDDVLRSAVDVSAGSSGDRVKQHILTTYKELIAKVPHNNVSRSPEACKTQEVDGLMQLVSLLHTVSKDVWNKMAEDGNDNESMFDLSGDEGGNLEQLDEWTVPRLNEEFVSQKLTRKVEQQLQDALALCGNALPHWLPTVMHTCRALLPLETRQAYLLATAFGTARAITWLQDRLDTALENASASASGSGGMRRTTSSAAGGSDDSMEYRVGRLKHERVRVTRDSEILDRAMVIMKVHADRKSMLEIEFEGEEGTGLGPTLEFYSLIGVELQKKSLAIWLCDDEEPRKEAENIGELEEKKAIDKVWNKDRGLFPAPYAPQVDIKRVEKVFFFMGALFGKVLQDGRKIDLPINNHVLQLLVSTQIPQDAKPDMSEVEKWLLSEVESESVVCSLLESTVSDHVAKFIGQLQRLAAEKRHIMEDATLNEEQKQQMIEQLKFKHGDAEIKLEHLGICFSYSASSSVYGFTEVGLVDGGTEIILSMDNVEQYIKAYTEFVFCHGIKRQMTQLLSGLRTVCDVSRVSGVLSAEELKLMLCGEQKLQWTREDVVNHCQPKLGFTRDSRGFQFFASVLSSLSQRERKQFLQFATGCSSLPPGGLAALQPPLTVVRKVDSNAASTDKGVYPSVNTCVHYLKLPDYSSEEIMKERLISAFSQQGFHLN